MISGSLEDCWQATLDQTEQLMSFDPIAYINEPRWRHVSLGLDRMKLLLEKLGNPQDAVGVVHVAGTNGKGSVCAYLSSILCSQGYKCGLFTSPYIEHFEERIQVDGIQISEPALTEITLAVKSASEAVEAELGEHPTEFELMCAVAFMYFKRCACDIAVIEVGLGGRLDATNVVNPMLCVITKIGLDHCDVLGDTLEKIATEKAGIIKPGVPVVTCSQDAGVMRVIEDACEANDCTLYVVDDVDVVSSALSSQFLERSFTYKGAAFTTKLIASYQPINASIAIEAARVLQESIALSDESIREGIRSARWPGRFDVLGTDPLFVVDGAHNPQGISALVESIDDLLEGSDPHKRIGIFGVLADKGYQEMVEIIAPHLDSVIFYEPDNPRALDADSLMHEFEKNATNEKAAELLTAPSPEEAVKVALDMASPEDFVIAFGTLYSIAQIKSAYRSLCG